jgi:hypothetical protein
MSRETTTITTAKARDVQPREMKNRICKDEVLEMIQNIEDNSFLVDYKLYVFRKGCILKTTGAMGDTPHIEKLTRLHWTHKSKSDRCYILGEIPSGYMYISMDLEAIDFMETSMKIYVSESYADLVDKAMSRKAYKKYIKDTEPIDDESAL